MTERQRGQRGIMVSALPSLFSSSFREMAVMRQGWQNVCPQARVIGFWRVRLQRGQDSSFGSGTYLFCRVYYVWPDTYYMLRVIIILEKVCQVCRHEIQYAYEN